MPRRVDPLLDDAGGFLAPIGDILGACAARAAAIHEAVVVEAVAPRHVSSVLAGERGEGTVGAQLTEPVRCAEAVERGRGFRCAQNGKRAAAGHRRREQRACNIEKFHGPPPKLPFVAGLEPEPSPWVRCASWPILMSRFRSSQYLAAHSDANFGI